MPPPDRRTLLAGASAAVVILVIAAVAGFLIGRDRAGNGDGDSDDGGGTTSPASSTSSTEAPPEDLFPVVWPAAAGDLRYDDPVDAALGFATDFVGFAEPVAGEFRSGDGRSGEVDIRPRPDGPVTTVLVRQVAADGTWWVLGSAAAAIEVVTPSALAPIWSTVTVRGRSTAFEGTVGVEVRADGVREPVATGFVTGGANGEMGPFEGTLSYPPPEAEAGAVVFFTESGEDGRVWQASVVRVRFRNPDLAPASCAVGSADRPDPGPDETVVAAYFTCVDDPDGAPMRVYRTVPSTTAVLRASLTELLAGPTTEEREAGLTSPFSSTTADFLLDVELTDGIAVVDLADLRPVIPDAATAEGARRLLAELDATVFQYDTVTAARYRLSGNCDAWADWLRTDGCDRER